MAVAAKFPGRCSDCGDYFEVGELIRSDEGDPSWRHAVCPVKVDPLFSPHPVCSTCWLTHPEGTCNQ